MSVFTSSCTSRTSSPLPKAMDSIFRSRSRVYISFHTDSVS